MKTWTKTKIQGLMRHKTGRYYARLYVGDKEKWVSLRTDLLEVAKARFRTDEGVLAIRERQVRGISAQSESYTFEQAKGEYFDRLTGEVARGKLKPGTLEYWKTVLHTVENSWLKIMKTDLLNQQVAQIKKTDCKAWAAAYLKTPSKRESRKSSGAKSISPRYYNNSVFALRSVFKEAIEAGYLHVNPAGIIGTARVPETELNLPTKIQFQKLVVAVRAGTHRTSAAAADVIEFLAYSGCRIGEARRVCWTHINLSTKRLSILGDPVTGTKNWSTRTIPALPAMMKLLNQMQKQRMVNDPDKPVMQVRDVRGALIRGCREVGAPLITHHDLRHLFATTAIESGVDIPTVSRWLGHQDGGALAMKTYGHLRDQHSQDSAAKVKF
jgi:integrase